MKKNILISFRSIKVKFYIGLAHFKYQDYTVQQ
jgi:hypothetical protein